MIFNRWRKYPKRKPITSGWYLCQDRNAIPWARILYYDIRTDKWIDSNRQSVFDGYVVYKVCRAPIEENHVCTDSQCVRDADDIMAWRKLPRRYCVKTKGNKDENNI